jgi:hypothetical protein
MQRLTDLVRDIIAADAKCITKAGGCKARSCVSTGRGCVSTSRATEKLRAQLRDLRPDHPLLALLGLPAAVPIARSDRLRAPLVRELEKKDRLCDGKRIHECRKTKYCMDAVGGCRNTSKAAQKLRERLDIPPPAARIEAQLPVDEGDAAPPAARIEAQLPVDEGDAAPPATRIEAQLPVDEGNAAPPGLWESLNGLTMMQQQDFKRCAMASLKKCPRPGDRVRCRNEYDQAGRPIDAMLQEAIAPDRCVAMPKREDAPPEQEPTCFDVTALANWWQASKATTDPMTRQPLRGLGCTAVDAQPANNENFDDYDTDSESDIDDFWGFSRARPRLHGRRRPTSHLSRYLPRG